MTMVKNRLIVWRDSFRKATIRRQAMIVVAGLIIIGLPLYLLLAHKAQQPQYQTAQAEKGTLVLNVTASGTISAGNSVPISSSATGVVSQVYAKVGDSVTPGEVLAEIAPDTNSIQKQAAAWSSYLSAENNLNAAKAKMNSLQSALFKANQAFVNDKGTSNPDTSDPTYIEENADWQQAQADYNNQSSVISQAEAAVSSAWLSYAQLSSNITSPATGTLTSFPVTVGLPIGSSGASSSQTSSANGLGSSSTVSSNNSSQSLGTITLPGGQLQAIVNLSEIDVTQVQVGQKVTMTLDAFPNKTFTGYVSSIDTTGTVSSGVTTYPVTITFDSPPGNIYPNMAVNATIITKLKDNVLTVPSTAVQTAGGQPTVRVLKNGQVQTVDVETGDSSDTDTEITSGLQEGDTVIISVIPTSTSGSRTTTSPFGGGGFGSGAVFRSGGGGNVRVFRGGGG